MGRILEHILIVLLSIATTFFILFLIFEFVHGISRDYQYAVIGALGSLIGGSLTLVGVWWTLNNQSKADFVNAFPKKISSLEKLQSDIKQFRNSRFIFTDIFGVNKQATYWQRVASMKLLTTEIDGNCYFIVSKLDNLYDDYDSEKKKVKKYEPEMHDQFGRPILTKESIEKIGELEKEYTKKIDEIIDELENYSKDLTEKFFKYKGNK